MKKTYEFERSSVSLCVLTYYRAYEDSPGLAATPFLV